MDNLSAPIVEANVLLNERYHRLWNNLKEHCNSELWEDARKEWKVVDIEFTDDDEKCVCGKALHNLFYAKNIKNGSSVILGSECVETVTGANPKSVSTNLGKVLKDKKIALNEAAILFLCDAGVLNEGRERIFLEDTCKRKFKKMSEKQQKWRLAINDKVIRYLNRRKT